MRSSSDIGEGIARALDTLDVLLLEQVVNSLKASKETEDVSLLGSVEREDSRRTFLMSGIFGVNRWEIC